MNTVQLTSATSGLPVNLEIFSIRPLYYIFHTAQQVLEKETALPFPQERKIPSCTLHISALPEAKSVELIEVRSHLRLIYL